MRFVMQSDDGSDYEPDPAWHKKQAQNTGPYSGWFLDPGPTDSEVDSDELASDERAAALVIAS